MLPFALLLIHLCAVIAAESTVISPELSLSIAYWLHVIVAVLIIISAVDLFLTAHLEFITVPLKIFKSS